MKSLSLFLLATILLSGCTPAPVAFEPTLIATVTSLSSATVQPTATFTPTITPTPSLPEAIEFTFDKAIPDNFVEIVKTTVNQAYWFYVGLGCSPKFYHVTVLAHESAGGQVDGIEVGWNDLVNISTNMDIRISHEMAHAMCQLAIKQDPETGSEMEWLLEGMANYFADNERLINTGSLSGWHGNVHDHQVGMAEWVVEKNYCDYPFKLIEKDIEPLGTGAWAQPYPDAGGVGEVAATLLANTTTDGTAALINYYRYLAGEPSDSAFEKAFGRTKDGFYQQFAKECKLGFPALGVVVAPFNVVVPTAVSEIPSPTSTQETVIVATGVLILKDNTQKFSDFAVAFCNIEASQCVSGILVFPDGTFSAQIPEGKYRISINMRVTGETLGWYTKSGLVIDSTCATIITVDVKHETALTINLQEQSCP